MDETVAALLPDLRVFYEDLHAHPELSFAEHRTSGLMADRLEALGYEVTRGVGGTGVVAVMSNGDGPTVLLRADMDALPVEEATGLPYASTVRATDASGAEVPVAHACGHDMHATWMIGAATILAADRDSWSGTALLVVQPAEEIGAGAAAMIDDGLFERFGTPDVALGQHVVPFPAGQLLYRAGPVMAASDALKIVLHGRGAHASAPEQSVDPIVMGAAVVTRLQTVVSREVAATDAAVVTVGSFHAGSKENIISDSAELQLSVRTFDPAVREHVLDGITRITEAEAQASGAPQPPEITSMYAFPAVSNDAEATERVAAAFTAHFGAERVTPGPVASASEDFSLFGERGGFPYVFWFVGGTDPAAFAAAMAAGRIQQDIPFNHSPLYAPEQDPTMATGIEALVTAARVWLGR
jgi:amidohydrolase